MSDVEVKKDVSGNLAINDCKEKEASLLSSLTVLFCIGTSEGFYFS